MDTERELPSVPIIKPISFIFVQVTWRNTRLVCPPGYRQIDINPTDEYPFGRKGLALTNLWRSAKESDTKGLLILDGDVAIDPHDHAAMVNSIRSDYSSVWIGPAKIWPISTNFSTWVWAHRKNGAARITEWQEYCTDPDTFSFCYTFLPERLLGACIQGGMAKWCYPNVDYNVVKKAQSLDIPVRVVEGCYPKHMNY